MTTQIAIDHQHGAAVTWKFVYFGSHIVSIETEVTLQMDPEKRAFQFWIHSDSTIDGKKQAPVDRYRDVSGNIPPTTIPSEEDPARLTTFSVSNWNLNGTILSCTMSLRIEHTKFGGLGPSDIFIDKPFSGIIPSL